MVLDTCKMLIIACRFQSVLLQPQHQRPPAPGSVDSTPHALCVGAAALCRPSCRDVGASAAHAPLTPSPLPHGHPEEGCPPMPPPGRGSLAPRYLPGMLRGDALWCPSRVTAPPPAPRHLPLVSLSYPGYCLIRMTMFLVSAASFG